MKKMLTCLATVFVSTVAMAQNTTPFFQASLTPEYALQERTERIEGLILNIWGENPQTAFAWGGVNGSTGDSGGFTWALLMNYAEDYTGVMWAPVNYASGDVLGWQGGIANYVEDEMRGLQLGWVNYAGSLTGLQLSFVNFAERADRGVQIGILNIIRENRLWFREMPDAVAPAMVFVNWRF